MSCNKAFSILMLGTTLAVASVAQAAPWTGFRSSIGNTYRSTSSWVHVARERVHNSLGDNHAIQARHLAAHNFNFHRRLSMRLGRYSNGRAYNRGFSRMSVRQSASRMTSWVTAERHYAAHLVRSGATQVASAARGVGSAIRGLPGAIPRLASVRQAIVSRIGAQRQPEVGRNTPTRHLQAQGSRQDRVRAFFSSKLGAVSHKVGRTVERVRSNRSGQYRGSSLGAAAQNGGNRMERERQINENERVRRLIERTKRLKNAVSIFSGRSAGKIKRRASTPAEPPKASKAAASYPGA